MKQQELTLIEKLTIEQNDLDDKIGKLDAFMQSEKFKTLSIIQQGFLRIQHNAMLTYSQILFERIDSLR